MSAARNQDHAMGAWLTEGAPDHAIPEESMPPVPAMRLLEEELAVEGIPERNLATFVTTWMEPEARAVIDANLHRNFIDHAEYPQTFAIQQRCIRMLAELFHAPGETTGTSTQGSSEAIMLGALSLKWKWRQRREADGKPTDRPNLVFGGDVHVVWEKFCRYFDVEPRIVPLQPGKYTIGPEDVEPHVDENTIGVAAVVGTTFTGHADDVAGINELLIELKDRQGLDVPLHIDGASGAFVWPFLYPHSEWDFRLEQVRSINAVVAETNDGTLNDIRSRPVGRDEVFRAIQSASVRTTEPSHRRMTQKGMTASAATARLSPATTSPVRK